MDCSVATIHATVLGCLRRMARVSLRLFFALLWENTNVDRSVATIHATVLGCLRRMAWVCYFAYVVGESGQGDWWDLFLTHVLPVAAWLSSMQVSWVATGAVFPFGQLGWASTAASHSSTAVVQAKPHYLALPSAGRAPAGARQPAVQGGAGGFQRVRGRHLAQQELNPEVS